MAQQQRLLQERAADQGLDLHEASNALIANLRSQIAALQDEVSVLRLRVQVRVQNGCEWVVCVCGGGGGQKFWQVSVKKSDENLSSIM